MMLIIGSQPQRRSAGSVALRLAVAALLLAGTFAASANADDRHRDDRGRADHRDWHGHGGYYAPPPVVYGGPVYAPPPVVYGPGVGISIQIP
jgi:hypothetical protein